MEWQYLAGFFDGEGNIGYHNQPKFKIKRQVAIQISQKTKPVLEQIGTFLQSEGISHWGIYSQKNKWGGAYVLRIDMAKDINTFLEALIPYLIVKKEQAEVASKYLEESVIPFQKILHVKRRN